MATVALCRLDQFCLSPGLLSSVRPGAKELVPYRHALRVL